MSQKISTEIGFVEELVLKDVVVRCRQQENAPREVSFGFKVGQICTAWDKSNTPLDSCGLLD